MSWLDDYEFCVLCMTGHMSMPGEHEQHEEYLRTLPEGKYNRYALKEAFERWQKAIEAWQKTRDRP